MQAGAARARHRDRHLAGHAEGAAANAKQLGLKVKTEEADAEELPFEDASFDLVFGHAVLHHIPDLERAFGEFHRLLRRDGVLVFCGEPSRYGDLIAARPEARRADGGTAVAPCHRGGRAATTRPSPTHNGHALERRGGRARLPPRRPGRLRT